MNRCLSLFLSLIFSGTAIQGQDTLYVRKSIETLCSKKCFGRGYTKKGLKAAEKYIVAEIRSAGTLPYFKHSYVSPFYHTVNTFPGKCGLKINGTSLTTGKDFIPSPDCPPLKGRFRMQQADSTHFKDENGKLLITLRKKLTFSVAGAVEPIAEIDLDRNSLNGVPLDVEINIRSKLVQNFESRNIACYIEGSKNDSLIVFSAHYDHLGGIGKNTYFPGANDNASGVSLLLDLIRYYKIHPPLYRTVFIFFAGEEAGLLGSKAFVSEHKSELGKIKFLVNLDLLGTGDDGIMVVNGAIHEKELAMLNTINAEKKLVKEIRKRGKAANSDHYWFTEAGVPAFFIYTMGGRSAYHDVYDTAAGLPLTDYTDVFKLITEFVSGL